MVVTRRQGTRSAISSQSNIATNRHRIQISREDRQRTRRDLGPLRKLFISNRVRLRYERALQCFFDFATEQSIDFESHPSLLDDALSSYIELLWEEGDPKCWGGDAVSALSKFVPELKGEISTGVVTTFCLEEV